MITDGDEYFVEKIKMIREKKRADKKNMRTANAMKIV